MKKTLRYAVLTGIFLVPLTPALIFNSLFFPFITSKAFYFRILIELVGALWLLLALIDPSARPKRNWIFWAIAAFLLVIGIADLGSANPYKSFWSNFERMEGYITLIHLAMYALVAGSVLRAERLWNYFFATSLGVSIFISFYSLLQINHELVINQGGVRVDGTLGNAIYLAIYLFFHIFIAILLILNKNNNRKIQVVPYIVGFVCFLYYYINLISSPDINAKMPGVILLLISLVGLFAAVVYFFVYGEAKKTSWDNLSYAAILILEAVVLYYTATRGAIVGLFGALVVFALLLYFFGKQVRVYRIISLSTLGVIVVALGLFFGLRQIPAALESPILGRILSISFTNADIQAREKIWHIGYEGFKERPILGWGQESFNFVFNKYYDPSLYNREVWFDRTHNVIFDWLVAGGLLGLLSYLLLYASALYLLWKKERFSVLEKSIISALFAGYFLFILTVFDNIASYILFFTFLAYIAYEPEEKKDLRSGLPQGIALMYGALIVVFFFAALWYFNMKPITANQNLIEAITPKQEGPLKNYEYFEKVFAAHTFGTGEAREQLLQYAISVAAAGTPDEATKLKFVNFAADQLKQQVESAPNDARYNLFLGSFLSHFNQNVPALTYLSKAHELTPKKQLILFELGSLKLKMGRIPEALADFKEAYELEPHYEEARTVYAAGAIFAHDEKLVENLLNFEDGRLYLNDRILETYKATNQLSQFPPQLKKQIARTPQNIDLYTKLAQIDLALEDREGAVAALQQILNVKPDLKDSVDELVREIRAGKKF
jgi:O-antigen ligase